MPRSPFQVVGLLLFSCLATSPCYSEELKDLYFGEALYYAHQEQYFEALERLDTELDQHDELDEPQLDSLFHHINDAEFSLGDFELRYRMHHRAGRAIKAVLEGAAEESVRNDAAFRLARIHFQKNQMADALRALDRIDGKVPEPIRDDVEFLRASIYLAEARPSDAIDVLKRMQDSESFGGFAAYNLGIALLQNGQQRAAFNQLEKVGQLDTDDPAVLAIKDKSNLVLGKIMLDSSDYDQAKVFLNRVRLDGPFSNQALLSAGWAEISSGDYQRALVPWNILSKREVTDRSTQEAMLALPYTYGKLNVYGRAAISYGEALDSFGAEVEKLNASIDTIREGSFLQVLIREEIRQDRDWAIRMRTLPESPETFYLMELLATHDFQTGLENYLDLSDLKRKLLTWQASFDSFEDMVDIRRDHYEPLLPDVDSQFRELDSKMRLRKQQHQVLVQRLNDMLTTPRPEFLATREEQEVLARLEHLESQLLDDNSSEADRLKGRIKRLKGTVSWTLQTEYHERLTNFDQHLTGLNEAMVVVNAQHTEYVRARQAATHSFEGFDTPIQRLRAYVNNSVDEVDRLMARQGNLLEIVAIEELAARRRRLEDYRDNARYALADSYDRATQAQARTQNPQ